MSTKGCVLVTMAGKHIKAGAYFTTDMSPDKGGVKALEAAIADRLFSYINRKNADYLAGGSDLRFVPSEHSWSEFIQEPGGEAVDVEYTYVFYITAAYPMLKVYHWGKLVYDIPQEAFQAAIFAFQHEEVLTTILSADGENVLALNGKRQLNHLLQNGISQDFLYGLLLDASGCAVVESFYSKKTISGATTRVIWPISVWGPQFGAMLGAPQELAGLYSGTSIFAEHLPSGKYKAAISYGNLLTVWLSPGKGCQFDSEKEAYLAGLTFLKSHQERVVWFSVLSEFGKQTEAHYKALSEAPSRKQWERACQFCERAAQLVAQVKTSLGPELGAEIEIFRAHIDVSLNSILELKEKVK